MTQGDLLEDVLAFLYATGDRKPATAAVMKTPAQPAVLLWNMTRKPVMSAALSAGKGDS